MNILNKNINKKKIKYMRVYVSQCRYIIIKLNNKEAAPTSN